MVTQSRGKQFNPNAHWTKRKPLSHTPKSRQPVSLYAVTPNIMGYYIVTLHLMVLCRHPERSEGSLYLSLSVLRRYCLFLIAPVHEGELWPAHCSTPRYRLHGPTASRYWWAITLEIWCR